MNVGDKIKTIRISKNLTQKQLGELCGMADSAIRRYELGGAKPKIETLKRIATALGVGLEEFMTDSELSLFENMANLYLKTDLEINETNNLDKHTPEENYLIASFRGLNSKGRNKVTEYTEDLLKIKEYTENGDK